VKHKLVAALTILSWFGFQSRFTGIAAGQPLSAVSQTATIDFTRDIRPIFADRCYSCHGPEKQKSGFRLDLKEPALAGGDSGKVILPGKSRDSLLYRYIAGLHPEIRMPPKGEPLSSNQVALLRQWIDAGAIWPEESSHSRSDGSRWAFKRPERRAVPTVKNSRWVHGPIDAFVLSKLESRNISPSPEADRPTLMRRLSLDLIGLPPAPEEVARFVNDRRPDAYDHLVESLLSSPHFGERWGRHWLDLARYADSEGYQIDRARPYAYVYRNWVIDAFNRDLPFDQFTIEQLAGDLLPNATAEQKIAVGFHRNTLMNHEDGVDKEEFRCKAKSDRVATTGTTWLGLTLGCAECHTHKYDPITQKEFYQFYAFFNNAEELDFPAPQPEEIAVYTGKRKVCDGETTRIKSILADYSHDLSLKQSNWEATLGLPLTRWTVLQPANAISTDGTKLRAEKDKSVKAGARVPASDTYIIEATTDLRNVTGFRLEVLPAVGRKALRNKEGRFVLSEFCVEVQRKGCKPRPVVLQNASADLSLAWAPVTDAIDGVTTNGWAAGDPAHRHVAVFETREDIDCSAGAKLIFKLVQQSGWQMTIGRFRLSATTSPRPHAADLLPDTVVQILETPCANRSIKQRDELAKYFREEVDPISVKLNEKLQDLAKSLPQYQDAQAQGFRQSTNLVKTFVHVRGDFLRKGEEVQPGVLAALHSFKPRAQIADRLDLANWLVDPANPLTSRVTVNRIWQHLFGRGLVATSEDFGVRGEPPSDAQLLDWLATEFIRLGWSRKELIRLIVSSATYRQSARMRPDLASLDPNNALLARQNRFRVESEIVRDLYLCAGGLLNAELKGPSFHPPATDDFKTLGSAGAFTWVDSEGPSKYRRGVYAFTQRTVPYPVSMTFDAANPNESCPRRETSNTPLQALTLMNNPTFVECAQGLGRRMFLAPKQTVSERIAYGFELSLGRKPSREELLRLQKLFEQERRLVASNRKAAANLIGNFEVEQCEIDEAAALVAVAQVLMNLDEFLTRE